ncbi:MAG: hypothetical protein GY807_21075 [Gammaproteobacteria bacterium]|nr:hypothetical protein [Gammaproteobacteria bacterium]
MLSTIIGGLASGAGSYFGAKEQANAAKKATKLQRQQFDYQKGLAEPLYDRGTNANALVDAVYGIGYDGNQGQLVGDRAQFNQQFESSPIYQQYYQNALANANQAIDRQASAGGQLNSGRRYMALSDRAGNLAGNTLNEYLAGIQGVSNQGAGALNALTGASQNYGNAAARLAQDRGAANAAAYMGIGNSVNNTMSDLTQQAAQAYGMGGGSTSGYGAQNLIPNSYYGRR